MVFGAGLYEPVEKSLLSTLPGITPLEPGNASGAAAAIGGATVEALLSGINPAEGPVDAGGAALNGGGGAGGKAGGADASERGR
jgi:hypothetical protein